MPKRKQGMGKPSYTEPPPSAQGPWFDEIVGSGAEVHIERMREDMIWALIGGYRFEFFSEGCKASRINVRVEWQG